MITQIFSSSSSPLFLYLLQQSLSSFLRSFGCLQALRQIAHAATHRRLFHPLQRVMTLHPYLLEASEDLVAHANALQLPRQNAVMSFHMQDMTSSLISDPNSLVVGSGRSNRWKMRRRASGGVRGLLAELSGIPAGLGRGSCDSICGA